MKGIQLTAYGNLADVVKLADVPLVGIPKADEVIIDVEAVRGAKIWRLDSPKRGQLVPWAIRHSDCESNVASRGSMWCAVQNWLMK